MCSRYFIRDEKTGLQRDVHPQDEAEALIAGEDGVIHRILLRWGFLLPSRQGSSVVYNARVETAREKSLFGDSLLNRRCIVPALGFYEWNRAGEKAVFENTDGKVLYFAGFYKVQEETARFVILTTEANDSMKGVHDRMPLVITKEQAAQWLAAGNQFEKLLEVVPGELKKTMDFEQQVFKFL